MIPLRTDSRLRSTPWANWGIIAANIAGFMVQGMFGLTDKLALDARDPTLLDFFTYSLLHADVMHLFSNMLFLYIFGNNVNDKMGHVGYLGFYLSAAVVAGMGHMLSSGSPVLGASGAVSAVTGAYLVLFPRSSITIVYFFILIGSIEIPSMYFII